MRNTSKQFGFLAISLMLILGATCYKVQARDMWIEVKDYTPMKGEDVNLTLGYDHYRTVAFYRLGDVVFFIPAYSGICAGQNIEKGAI